MVRQAKVKNQGEQSKQAIQSSKQWQKSKIQETGNKGQHTHETGETEETWSKGIH